MTRLVPLPRALRRRLAAPPGRSRWDTWEPPRASVIGVARNLTSATRVLDVLRLLRREDGIEKYCAVNPGSAFGEGLGEYLASTGVRVLSWREATRRSFDLAVACSVHSSMRRLDAPLMVLPHGAGYNRLVTESTGDASSPAGLSRRELMRHGRVVPAAIGVSHEEQIERLARACPEAVPYATVVGDWCFQRILASLPHRDLYRERLGAVGGRRLVVVHSTWSEHSLLGRRPGLPLDLVTALPADEFVVAAVLHPNVWARAGAHGVAERLAAALDAGLRLIPPHEGWRAAVVAADWVVGDHGSTTFYSAAAERVTVLAATGLDELDPRSPAAEFGRRAPRLDPDADLYGQLLAAEAAHDPGLLRPVVDRQLGAVDSSGEATRRRMYAFLAERGVRPPAAPPRPDPVPPPEPVERRPPTVYDVTGRVADDGAVEVRRWPVVADHHDRARGFYAVAAEETLRHWLGSADVIARTTADAEVPAAEWVRAAAARHPGAGVLVAALGPHRCLVALRDGTLVEAASERAWGARRAALDPLLLGSAVHLWLVDGRHGDGPAGLAGQGLTVRTGRVSVRVVCTGRP
ncbi:hypothetical protein [Streptomyces montanisoli]|uniref:Translation initiation factor IF-2 n=1 Tax=Streptomyces montanisoli TaxID=2798581 RepID=A0A940MA04_9ACTN|nr:hypothetical protein [Streptomyces montanisoli]MBP0459045.1 hypothetical protein [Streptomyces montanisoli]